MIEYKGSKVVGTFNTGETEEIKLSEKNIINIQGNDFVPLYNLFDARRKDLPSIRLYKSGNIKSLSLQDSTEVSTKCGDYKVEKITFYEDGGINRIFPLDGNITGYWTEEDEKNLAKEYKFKFPFGNIKGKLISIHFYETQELKSLTTWPGQIFDINYARRKIKSKIGISLYKDGNLKSCEPSVPTLIETPIGGIDAFDQNAIGIHGEDNSLKFYEDGQIKSLITSTNVIKIKKNNGEEISHSPNEETLFAGSDILDLITVQIEFKEDKIVIDREYEYDINENTFEIGYFGERKLMIFK